MVYVGCNQREPAITGGTGGLFSCWLMMLPNTVKHKGPVCRKHRIPILAWLLWLCVPVAFLKKNVVCRVLACYVPNIFCHINLLVAKICLCGFWVMIFPFADWNPSLVSSCPLLLTSYVWLKIPRLCGRISCNFVAAMWSWFRLPHSDGFGSPTSLRLQAEINGEQLREAASSWCGRGEHSTCLFLAIAILMMISWISKFQFLTFLGSREIL